MRQPIAVRVTPEFIRAFRKLPKPIQKLASERDELFRSNPFRPSLRTHKLKGELEGFMAYSVNFSYRVLFRFLDNNEVTYYDVGTHDIYR